LEYNSTDQTFICLVAQAYASLNFKIIASFSEKKRWIPVYVTFLSIGLMCIQPNTIGLPVSIANSGSYFYLFHCSFTLKITKKLCNLFGNEDRMMEVSRTEMEKVSV
jgi:hypothetical protein